jgi:hypothetical protein
VGGTGRLVRTEGTMNGPIYRQILDENLLQSANNLRLGRRFYIPTGQWPQTCSQSNGGDPVPCWDGWGLTRD